MDQLHTTSVERTITVHALQGRLATLQANVDISTAKEDALELAGSSIAIATDLLKELKSAEQRHLDLTAALPQMLWTTRPDGFHIYFNQRWVEYTGRTLDESYGFGWLEAFHPDDRVRTLERWQQATASGEAYEIEYRLVRADGGYGWVLGRAMPLRDASGKISQWFGSCTDIDSQKKAEELAASQARELADANAQLTKAEELKGEFFSNVSHELRTPLTLLIAPLESLLSGDYGYISKAQKPMLNVIHNNALRLLQMVTGLLDFSKLGAKKFTPVLEPTNISALTQSIAADFMPLIQECGVTYEFFSSQSEIWVNIDRYLWERIVFNLLSNAIKFTPKGGRITVSLGIHDEHLVLKVKDTGIGISEANMPLLFQKFRQIESASTRRFEGTGLGLSLVKEFAQLINGDVSVTSTIGKGSIFTVDCDVMRANPADAAPIISGNILRNQTQVLDHTLELQKADASGRHSTSKVLIVEDNIELARYIVSQLRSICETRLANDGDEALEPINTWKPDLILSDVMMPKRDGISLCREVKGNPNTAKIPVILLTALTHRDALLQGWQAGADEYLFKPFHPRELIARVETMLDLSLERQKSEETLRLANLDLERKIGERTASLKQANEILKQSETAERAARLEAEHLARIKDEFLITLSHELRTPLVPIIGWIGLINSDALDSTGIAEALKTIERSARYELQLIEDLLDTSRIISGKLIIEFNPIDLIDPLKAAIETVRLTAEAKNITLNVSVPPASLGVIRGETRRLQQVIWNLLGNAIKFTPEGGRIDVRLTSDDKHAVIEISDNGIGIRPDFLPHVFERFRQADSSTTRQFGGLGLGLALARQLVEAHGGRISVESPGVGLGSTFRIELPLSLTQPNHRAESPIPEQTQTHKKTVKENKLAGLKILVVDDSPEDRQYLTALLTSQGAVVTAAMTADEALVITKHDVPDVLVSDIGMPDKDGYEFIREIREMKSESKNLPALALTAYGSANDRERAIVAGFQLYLTKPSNSDQLIGAIFDLAHQQNFERRQV